MSLSTKSKKPSVRLLMLGAGLDVQGGITSVEKLMLEHAPPQLQIQHVETFVKGSTSKNISTFFKAAIKLFLFLLKREIDLVHIHFSERGSTLRKMVLVLIILIFQKPFILHAHGPTYKEFFETLPRQAQFFLVALFSRCAKLIALSESWEKFYLTNFQLQQDQVEVLMNPVQLPTALPDRSSHQDVTFIFLGRIGKRGGALDAAKSVITLPQQDKGAFDLIKAFAALPEQQRASAKMILAGNGDVETAQALIREFGLESQVTVYSWLNSTQRDELLAKADVFVLPSYNEGLPMSMLEAMAWGLPVIVTPVGGIPEIITHGVNGLLVEPGNHRALVQSMTRLIVDRNLRFKLGAASRRDVEPLDVQKYMQSLVAVYASVLKQNKHPSIRRVQTSG